MAIRKCPHCGEVAGFKMTERRVDYDVRFFGTGGNQERTEVWRNEKDVTILCLNCYEERKDVGIKWRAGVPTIAEKKGVK